MHVQNNIPEVILLHGNKEHTQHIQCHLFIYSFINRTMNIHLSDGC